jgi:hypothetical protein
MAMAVEPVAQDRADTANVVPGALLDQRLSASPHARAWERSKGREDELGIPEAHGSLNAQGRRPLGSRPRIRGRLLIEEGEADGERVLKANARKIRRSRPDLKQASAI